MASTERSDPRSASRPSVMYAGRPTAASPSPSRYRGRSNERFTVAACRASRPCARVPLGMRVADFCIRMLRHALGAWLALAFATVAAGREPGQPIRLEFVEGDVAGFSAISAVDAGG